MIPADATCRMNKPAHSRSNTGRPQSTAVGWLGRDTRGAGVLATAQRYLDLQQAVAALLPPGLGEVCAVARLENRSLQLAVPGPAHAAKLRQMAPSLAASLAKQGWLLDQISVRIQAGMLRPGTRAAARPPRDVEPLGPEALQAFEELGRELSPGPLADAVARLLAHHKHGS
jgi:hypothetical protein